MSDFIPRFLLALLGLALSVQGQVVPIPDTAFRNSLWQALGKPLPIGELTRDDLRRVRRLELWGEDIVDLEGLQTAESLEELVINYPNQPAIRFPTGLSRLTRLSITEGSLTDVAFLEGLPQLTHLTLSFNSSTGFLLPAGMSTQLVYLDLGFNQLPSISLPAGMSRLEELYLNANQLIGLEPPPGLQRLRILSISENPLTRSSLVLPDDLESLEELSLDYCRLEDLRLPNGLDRLRTLSLVGNAITNLDFLRRHPALTSLAITSDTSDLAPFEALGNLQILTLGVPPDVDLTPLRHLGRLTNLSVSGGLARLPFPAGLTNVTRFDTGDNRLTELDFLRQFPALRHLKIGRDSIPNLVLPSGLASLEVLDLDFSNVTRVQVPEDILRLHTVLAGRLPMTDYSFVRRLPHLTTLDLRQAPVTNFSFLDNLTNLRSLDLGLSSRRAIVAPQGLTGLTNLGLGQTRLQNLAFLTNYPRLLSLDLGGSTLRELNLPPGLQSLRRLNLGLGRNLTNVTFGGQAPPLTILNLSGTSITDLRFLAGLTGLAELQLGSARRSPFHLPPTLPDLRRLKLDFSNGPFPDFAFLATFPNLVELDVSGLSLREFSVPTALTHLSSLLLSDNPLERLHLSADLAETSLSTLIDQLQSDAVQVSLIQVVAKLKIMAFDEAGLHLQLVGPPGTYSIEESSDLQSWTPAGTVSLSGDRTAFIHARVPATEGRFLRTVQP